MSLFFKSFLTISILLVSSLLSETKETANLPNCDHGNPRSVSLRVENKAGTLVDNLRAEDFSLIEDKTSREILRLENRTNESVAIAILIDASASQERSLPQTRLAAQDFVQLAMHTNKDRAAVISFTGRATMEAGLTSNISELKSAIARVKFVPPPGYAGGGIVVGGRPPAANSQQIVAGSSAIWDAISTTTNEVLKDATSSRRAIVLITDGVDTSSRNKLSAAIADASRNDVAVFAIGVGSKDFDSPDHNALNKLTEETGGRAFFPKKALEQSAILRQIDQEIRSDYLLTYCGSGANMQKKPFKLKIQFTNPQVRESNRVSYRRYGF